MLNIFLSCRTLTNYWPVVWTQKNTTNWRTKIRQSWWNFLYNPLRHSNQCEVFFTQKFTSYKINSLCVCIDYFKKGDTTNIFLLMWVIWRDILHKARVLNFYSINDQIQWNESKQINEILNFWKNSLHFIYQQKEIYAMSKCFHQILSITVRI